jgi:hypothetical protein
MKVFYWYDLLFEAKCKISIGSKIVDSNLDLMETYTIYVPYSSGIILRNITTPVNSKSVCVSIAVNALCRDNEYFISIY